MAKGVEVARRVDDYRTPLFQHPAELKMSPELFPHPGTQAEVAAVQPAGPTEAELEAEAAKQAEAARLAEAARQAEALKALHLNPVRHLGEKKLDPVTPADRLLSVEVAIRPWGDLVIDGTQKLTEVSTKTVSLSRGRHTFAASCPPPGCEARGVSREVDVEADGQKVLLEPPLSASLISVEGFPPEATVKIGSAVRSVADLKKSGYQFKGALNEGHYDVSYEVRLGDQLLDHGTLHPHPGELGLIRKGN